MSLIAGHSDWIESKHSKRVWLSDSMTALGQFAYINPLYKVMHWYKEDGRRVKCWIDEGSRCFHCEKNVPQIKEYTYGIYPHSGSEIHYFSTTLSTHTYFRYCLDRYWTKVKTPVVSFLRLLGRR